MVLVGSRADTSSNSNCPSAMRTPIVSKVREEPHLVGHISGHWVVRNSSRDLVILGVKEGVYVVSVVLSIIGQGPYGPR